VRNIKFEKCSVKIDENGNVMIEAQGYRVKRLEGSAPPPPVAQQQPPQQQPPPQQQAVPVMVPVGMPYAYQQPMAPPPRVQAPKITSTTGWSPTRTRRG